jgi:hypothetical protein
VFLTPLFSLVCFTIDDLLDVLMHEAFSVDGDRPSFRPPLHSTDAFLRQTFTNPVSFCAAPGEVIADFPRSSSSFRALATPAIDDPSSCLALAAIRRPAQARWVVARLR